MKSVLFVSLSVSVVAAVCPWLELAGGEPRKPDQVNLSEQRKTAS